MTTYNTGNPVPSGDARDRFDNTQTLDEFVSGPVETALTRLGDSRLTLVGMEAKFYTALSNLGFESTYLTYAAGVIIQRPTQLVIRSGIYYRVTDPANVPLTLTGNWDTDSLLLTDVGDASLRAALAPTGSTVVIGGATAGNVGKLATNVTIDTDGRMRTAKIAVGTNAMTGSAVRDAIGVYRNLVGLTDCHGLVDNTVISGVTDYGGYGAMDVTVTLQGANNQNHVFSYQSRPNYAGSGNIQHLADFLARPVHSGTGVINERIGIDVGDLTVTNGGAVDQQIGIYVRNLMYGTAKVALNIAQSTGFVLYAPGGARSYHAGPFRVGVDDASTVPFSVGVGGSPNFYVLPQTGSATAGVSGDSFFRIATNATTRVEVANAAGQSAFRPGADNAQPLGDATKRWSQVFAGTTAISASDAREKTPVRELREAEKSAAIQISKEVGFYQWLESVKAKGESARWFPGLTVQRVMEILKNNGLDPFSYSFICYDKWDRVVVEHAATEVEGEKVDAWTEVVQEAGDRYSFRPTDLQFFIAAGISARLEAAGI